MMSINGEVVAPVGNSGDVESAVKRVTVDENTSDGYHTFKELYEFRLLYNAALFNEWSWKYNFNVHKSKRHSDGGLCFGGGWFVVMAQLPTGQISNHYELKDWDLFDVVEVGWADKWDGHTAADVATRLRTFLQQNETRLTTKESSQQSDKGDTAAPTVS